MAALADALIAVSAIGTALAAGAAALWLLDRGFAWIGARAGLPRARSARIVAAAATLYAAILLAVFLREAALHGAMMAHDLDGNGWIDSAEITPEARQAMRRVGSDTARTFAPVSAALWVALSLGVWQLAAAMMPRRRRGAG